MDRKNSGKSFKDPGIRYLCCETDSVLACGKGVDDKKRPIQQDTHGTVSILPNAGTYSQEGLLFSVTGFIVIPNSGQFLALTFENPAANNKTMYLDNVSGGIFVNEVIGTRNNNEETLNVVIAETTTTAGEQVTPVNYNLGASNTSTIIVRRVPDFDLTGVLYSANYPTGEFSKEIQGRIIVPPGHILLINIISRVRNINNALLDATVSWFEL